MQETCVWFLCQEEPWRRKWQATPIFLPGKSNGQRSQVGYSPVQFSHSNSLHPIDCSMPSLPVHHQLPESTQTHVHWVGDAIQQFHLLSSPSPPTFCLSQNQGLFKWVSSSHQVAKVLEFQLKHQSFQWIFRTDFLMRWLDLLAVHGTLKSLLQHHSLKASVLQHSTFFIV